MGIGSRRGLVFEHSPGAAVVKAPPDWRDVRTLAKHLATEDGRDWRELTTIELGTYYARARAELARAPSRPRL